MRHIAEARESMEKAVEFAQQGQMILALEHVNRCIELDPEESFYRGFRGQLFYDLKKYDVALKEVAGHLKQDPQSVPGLFLLGGILMEKKKWKDAEAAFKALLGVQIDFTGAYNNLGIVYSRKRRWKDAVEMFRIARKLDKGDDGIRENLAYAAGKLKAANENADVRAEKMQKIKRA